MRATSTRRALLGSLPSDGPRVLVGPGENAGVVDIGDGLAVVFKVESHNHPSAVEPYQGAATGVGGIIRDIFTMGARPMALLNGLRFGPLDPAEDPTGRTDAAAATRNRYLLGGVVAGIAGYGNCIGIPDVGGELFFDPSCNGNPLVNALCLGIARHDEITLARAAGPGQRAAAGRRRHRPGRDRRRLVRERHARRRPRGAASGRPGRQPVPREAAHGGLPRARRSDGVLAMQDLGAAGLTCALSEVSARGDCGADVDLDLVPRREPHMTPYEVLLSESQERMLLVVEAGREAEVAAVFERYELHAVAIGRVMAEPVVRCRSAGERRLRGARPALWPTMRRATSCRPPLPPTGRTLRAVDLAPLAEEAPSVTTLLELLGSANARSRKPVWRRYDHMNGTNTIVGPGAGDAALLRVKGTGAPWPWRSTARGGSGGSIRDSPQHRPRSRRRRTWPAPEPSRSPRPTA